MTAAAITNARREAPAIPPLKEHTMSNDFGSDAGTPIIALPAGLCFAWWQWVDERLRALWDKRCCTEEREAAGDDFDDRTRQPTELLSALGFGIERIFGDFNVYVIATREHIARLNCAVANLRLPGLRPPLNPDGLCEYDDPQELIDAFDGAESCYEGDRGRASGETLVEWAQRVALTEDQVETIEFLIDVSDGALEAMGRLLANDVPSRRASTLDPSRDGTRFVAAGLIPHNNLTLLFGAKTAGKSTLALSLAVDVASGREEWCGFAIPPEVHGRPVVYISGEDGRDILTGRVHWMTGGRLPRNLYLYARERRPLPDILNEARDLRPVLTIIDPARSYLDGNEDSSEAVDQFYRILEDFIAATGSGVVVVHHLKKNARPTSLNDAYFAVRGSAVFLDRPRVIIAAVRREGRTYLGIPAPDGQSQHNLCPDEMFTGERVLLWDERTLRHVPLDKAGGRESADSGAMEAAVEDATLAAIGRLTGERRKVTRTGKSSLFALKPPELKGVSRKRVEEAVAALLASGRARVGDGGAVEPSARRSDADAGVTG